MGEPINVADTGLDIKQTWNYKSLDGTVLIAVYPNPVALSNTSGDVVGHAKWVAAGWDRTGGRPDYLVYGIKPYDIDGAYAINSDISGLTASVPVPGK